MTREEEAVQQQKLQEAEREGPRHTGRKTCVQQAFRRREQQAIGLDRSAVGVPEGEPRNRDGGRGSVIQ